MSTKLTRTMWSRSTVVVLSKVFLNRGRVIYTATMTSPRIDIYDHTGKDNLEGVSVTKMI